MDRGNLEPGHRMYADIAGMRPLLCKNVRRAVRGGPGHPYEQGFALKLWPERLELPIRWKKPRKIFVNSMSDWCHEDIPDAFVLSMFTTMLEAQWHTYQLLTKRAPRMLRLAEMMTDLIEEKTGSRAWPAHIWLGVSVESEAQRGRITLLRQAPARIRFVSYEPAIGSIAGVDLTGIHWLIAGAESGRCARPMDEDWVREARDLCQSSGTAFFYKQKLDERGHKVPLPELDGRIWNEYPTGGK